MLDHFAAELASPVCCVLSSVERDHWATTLETRAEQAAVVRAQLRGVTAPRAAAVKDPFLLHSLSSDECCLVRLVVLVGDLLASFYPHLGQDLHTVVREDIGLGVVPAGRVHHRVDGEQASPSPIPRLRKL